MKYDNTPFASTAEYYADYRPKYPQELLNRIVEVFQLGKEDAILDLGCGTGEITIPLSKYVEKVIAWDPDSAMLALAQKKAEMNNAENIVFELKSSDNLSSIKNKVKLATMGQSLHWMDGPIVLAEIKKVLVDNGGVAIVGLKCGIHVYSESFEEINEITAKRNSIISEVVAKYLGNKRKAGKHTFRRSGQPFEGLLENAGFRDIQETTFDFIRKRSIDETVGYVFSTSWGSKAQLGDKVTDFEKELRERLLELEPTGVFDERLVFNLITARK